MQDATFGELTLKAERAGAAITVHWLGKSVDRQPSKVLDPYFDALLEEATAASAQVELRFERVEHFNSSTITSLISLVQRARAKKVKLAFVYDKAQKWQRLSFDALRVLGKGDGLLEIRSV